MKLDDVFSNLIDFSLLGNLKKNLNILREDENAVIFTPPTFCGAQGLSQMWAATARTLSSKVAQLCATLAILLVPRFITNKAIGPQGGLGANGRPIHRGSGRRDWVLGYTLR